MDIENIKALAEILTKNSLTSLELCEGETKIKLEKAPCAAIAPPSMSAATAPLPTGVADYMDTDGQPVNFNNLIEVKSPLVGVFYSAQSSDADPFVTIGSKVKKGDVLCIVEAMKLMNEITAEVDGEIVDICIKNGDIAEFGQVLFRMY